MCIHLLLGSNFQNISLERVLVTVPVIPINPSAGRSACAIEVQAIQVCVMTPAGVPPASLELLYTVHTPFLIVYILRAKRLAVMIAERITWNTNNVTNRIVNTEDTKRAWSLSYFHFDTNGDNGYKQIYELHPCCGMAPLKAIILHTGLTLTTFHQVLSCKTNLKPDFQERMRPNR